MRKFFLLVCLLVSGLLSQGQEVELVFQDYPLNEVLLELRDRYNLQFSFDDARLRKYQVTVSRTFSNPQSALDHLLKNLPLTYEKAGEVFLIFDKLVVAELKNYRLAGHFADHETSESLPFTHVLINGHGLMTDQKGNFSFVSNTDSLFRLQASYLGYYQLDSLVHAGTAHRFLLVPSTFSLKEIKVEGAQVVRTLQVGYTPGVMRLNHQIAGRLPGYGDNSVFNLLRLQPGILAAGEQSNDLIIRGSYEGQSQVLFDGFTLFGMKNFNDNISAVNPFLAKDIQVMKGGFGAEHGERVGGIVNITGADGDVDDTHLRLNLNNMTLNGYFSVPVGGKAALVMALRQTYYELYETGQISIGSRGRSGRGNLVDRNLYPDYNFRDLNLKLSGKSDGGDSYSISFLQGTDRFTYSLELSGQQSNLLYEDKENNLQTGLSVIYNKGWKRGNRSELTLAWSELESEVINLRQTGRQLPVDGGRGSGGPGGGSWQTSVNNFNQNKIAEAKVALKNQLAVSATQNVGLGGGLYYNQVHFVEDSFQVNLVHQQIDGTRLFAYLEDQVSFGPQFSFTAGLRADYPLNIEKTYLQPRFSASWEMNDHAKMNGAWGLYRQYIARSSVIDELGNYRYLWAVCDNEAIPVQQSQHSLLGFTWNRNDFTFSVEGYYKHTTGLTRYVEDANVRNLYEGKSKSKGLDFLIRKDYRGHSFWAAYTLSQTMEQFAYFTADGWQRALHDQRHELKMAVLFQLKPFYLSANYVYGSGFPDPLVENSENFERDYHRLDVAAVYHLPIRRFALEAGVSVLNVFNYENIKYANFIRVPDDQDATVNLHAEAVPFTPTMFLSLSF
ncbi:TonB-dependent receptor plug domain-containing protein [Gaoshiqia sediminis]|uniref:TonB-dependent receptor plug domain-containing protein n=1 Tax=Gaoshiqia sediminis TaxID=2986998 RepID=A0AA41Y4W1_9BACT|nr:TonB-dependent receptor plug domain-containing protein [Gaoshiqia sediminis]MCW0481132.1 TonB-dependent receptor plug domain-containing protein [Gaoshiqia sediminis]